MLAALAAPLVYTSCSSRSTDVESQVKSDVTPEKEQDLRHPSSATAWHTRSLVATTPQPGADRISQCTEQLDAVTATASSEAELEAAPAALAPHTAKAAGLYHACFYQLMVRLDDRLAAGGPVMTELADAFFTQMKSLWILARALDRTAAEPGYLAYLQHRYVQLSRDYFGRDVDIVAPPLGDRRGGPALPVRPTGSSGQ